MKKKIKIIAPNLSGKGGTEKVLDYIFSSALIREKFNLTLVLPDIPEYYEWLNQKIYFETTKLKQGNRTIFILKQLIFDDIDVVICLGPRLCYIANQVKKYFKKNFIILSWIHFPVLGMDFMNPKYLKYADGHLAINSETVEQLETLGILKNNIKVIYNPVYSQKIKKQDIKQENLIKIGYVGRLILGPPKNLSTLFKVVAALAVEKKIELHIVGSGNQDSELKDYANNMLKSLPVKINWYGWQEKPWDVLPYIDVFLLTSTFEAFGLVLVEAISRNIPIVSTDLLEIRDFLKEGINGEVAPADQVEIFKQKVLKVLKYDEETRSNIYKSLEFLYDTNYDERFIQAIYYFLKCLRGEE